MSATTSAAIRNRMLDLVEAITPRSQSGVRFLRYEAQMAFVDWAVAHPTGCLRRFDVRDDGEQLPPVISNTDVEDVTRAFACTVAYQRVNRFGQSLRYLDDVIDEDAKKIEQAIGTNGLANFAAYDCAVQTERTAREELDALVFLTVRLSVRFWRSMT